MRGNEPTASRTGSPTRITTFAGSTLFVYLHLLWFGCWIGFGVEGYPYGLLTMIVSLATFVMISQNRADAKRQVIASQQWQTVQEEDKQNRELLDVSNQILDLTKAIHARTDTRPDIRVTRLSPICEDVLTGPS